MNERIKPLNELTAEDINRLRLEDLRQTARAANICITEVVIRKYEAGIEYMTEDGKTVITREMKEK